MKFSKAFYLLIVIFIIGCQNKVEKPKEVTETEIDTQKREIHIVFKKDGLETNQLYKDSSYLGIVNYVNGFDSITKTIYNEESYPKRRIFFYKVKELLPDDLIEQPIEQIFKDHEIDTLYAARHDKIPFRIVPNKSGKFYVNGSVEDIVFMKTKDTSKIRMLSSMIGISVEINVKDNNSSNMK